MDSMIMAMFVGVLTIGIGLIAIITMSKKGHKALNVEEYQRQWLDIEKSIINTKDSGALQFAVLQADKLLDKALKELGYKGETMGERMTSASRVFSQREAVWVSHKLRNRIAHEHTVNINPVIAKKALSSFKRALRDLGAI